MTQLAHAVQCAHLAERFGADDALVTAALLHDYGHLLDAFVSPLGMTAADERHALDGARHLSPWFPAAVTEPIRLHVAAKRFLCSTDPRYYEKLSAGSLVTLQLQGGLMTAAEVEEFSAGPYADAAIHLRRWDDLAKDPAAQSPELEHFRAFMREAMRPCGTVSAA